MQNRNSKSIAAEIDAHERQAAEIIPQLDAAITAFNLEVPRLLTSWVDNNVKAKIQQRASQIAKMSDDELAAFKKSVVALKQSFSEIPSRLNGNRQRWPHTEKHTILEYGYFQATLKEEVSKLGRIYAQAGLLDGMDTTTLWKKLSSGEYKYTALVNFSSAEETNQRRYEELHSKLAQITQNIAHLKVEFEQHRAAERFSEL